MNERIRELAKQAGAHWCEGYVEQPNGDSVWQEKAKVDTDEMDLALFAELIVRECAEICLEANDHKNILRHFGVEE